MKTTQRIEVAIRAAEKELRKPLSIHMTEADEKAFYLEWEPFLFNDDSVTTTEFRGIPVLFAAKQSFLACEGLTVAI